LLGDLERLLYVLFHFALPPGEHGSVAWVAELRRLGDPKDYLERRDRYVGLNNCRRASEACTQHKYLNRVSYSFNGMDADKISFIYDT
jgi:hypothetical protein